ncbi:ABC transporter permease [Sphingobacteriaceae bacterium]|nr:ABC transporter permease [Sphingobacteriaceae bacterium]
MNESPNKRAIIVGVFVLVGILFLIAGILTIGNLHSTFSTKLHVTTLFDDVGGLQKGNNIWFSGVKIGTIKKVEFYGDAKVRVIMSIDEKAQQYIRKDAKVKVSSDGLIGNKILVIYGGSSTAMAVQENDTLSVEKTFSTEDMMNTLQENNKNLVSITGNLKTISQDLSDGKGSIGKLIKDETLYNNLTATGNSLKNASDKANQVMTSLSGFTSGLNKKGTLANQLVTDTLVYSSLKRSVAKLNVITDTAAAMVSSLNSATRNPKTPAGVILHDEEAGAHLKSTLKNLDSGSKKLDEDLEAAQHSFLLKKYFKKKAKQEKK